MGEQTKPHPASFPIGSPQSRAVARSLLETFLPVVEVVFTRGSGQPNSEGPDTPVPCDSVKALVLGGSLVVPLEIDRMPDESLDGFKNRLREIAKRHRDRNFGTGIVLLPDQATHPTTREGA